MVYPTGRTTRDGALAVRLRGGRSALGGSSDAFVRLMSGFQARLFEVEVPLDTVHSFVADYAAVAQFDQGSALRSQQLSRQALVEDGAFLDSVLIIAEAGAEAAAAVIVEPAHPLCRVLAHPVLHRQFLDALERGLR